MKEIKLKGANREVGRSQGYVPLWLRDTFVDDGNGGSIPCMETGLMPTPEEIAKMAKGEPLVLRILGVRWPPIMLEVGDDISEEELVALKKYHIKLRAQRAIANIKTSLNDKP